MKDTAEIKKYPSVRISVRSLNVKGIKAPVSLATTLTSELVRAANAAESLSPTDVSLLLDRAVAMVQEIREKVGIVPIPHKDALIYVRTVAAGASQVSPEERCHALLHAAEMIRDLHIVADSGTEIRVAR